MIRELNRIRLDHGLKPLRRSPSLHHSSSRYARQLMRHGRVRPSGAHRRGRPLRVGRREPGAPLGLEPEAALHRAPLDGLAGSPRRDPVRRMAVDREWAARAAASTRARPRSGWRISGGSSASQAEAAGSAGCAPTISGRELAADLGERALLAVVERVERLADALGVLREQRAPPERGRSRVSTTSTARRSDASRWRTTSPRASSVAVTSVALALLQSKRRRSIRSSSEPPAVVSTTSAENPAADTPARSSSAASAAADGGLRPHQGLKGAMGEGIAELERRHPLAMLGGQADGRTSSVRSRPSRLLPRQRATGTRAGRATGSTSGATTTCSRRPLSTYCLEPLHGLRGPRAERRDAVLARDGHRLAVLEHRAGGAHLAHGVDEPADHLEGGLAAAEHERGGVEGPIARTMRSGGRSKASSRVRKPARRRPSSSACTWSDSRSRRGLESNSSTPCGRVAGATTRRAACSQPVAQRHAELALGVAPLALVRELERGKQDLLHRCARPSARRGSPRGCGRPRSRRSGRRRRAGALGTRGPRRAGARARWPKRCCASRAAPGAATRAR